ncbi:hypothetical protein Gotri_012246 [Gossypium trilobum]|uniref:Uncharacterized protein n=1 Tax=Gossypium trilobum TaxID=34281 RepID=A0A7J9DPK0_9ROSI|nr:hypothetical protein [Gossypium trilobum]
MQNGASTQLGAFPTTWIKKNTVQRSIQIHMTTKHCQNVSINSTEPYPQRYDHQEMFWHLGISK